MNWRNTIQSLHRFNGYWALADQVLVSGATFLTTIIAARGLGAQDFGYFASIVLVQLFVLAIQSAVIISPFQVLQAGYEAGKRKRYANATLLLQLLFIALLLVVGFLLIIARPGFMDPFFPAGWWILLATAGFLLQDYLRRFFVTEGRSFYAFVIDGITNLVQLAVLATFFFSRQLNLALCFSVIGLTYLPSLLLGMYWYRFSQPGAGAVKTTWREHQQHGRWLLATALLQWFAGNGFIVTAGLMLGMQTLGALRLAQNIFGILNVLFQAFENYVVPKASVIYRKSAWELPAYLKSVSLKTAALVAPVLLSIILFARFIFDVVGGAPYMAYASVLQGMTLVYLFVFLGYPVRIAIRVMLLNKSIFAGYCLTAAFSMAAAHPFVQHWGVAGVVAGLVINQLLLIGYWMYVLQQQKSLLWK